MKILILKTFVRGYNRHLVSGNVVSVRPHYDSRPTAAGIHGKIFFGKNPDPYPVVHPPQHTKIAYKLLKKKKSRPGEYFPLFVGPARAVPIGVWIAAENIPTKKLGLEPRPAWHCVEKPEAKHLKKKLVGGEERVWAEVEISADIDYQPIAESMPKKQMKNQVPDSGYYTFQRPKGQGGFWILAGAMKVNRILTQEEVDEINAKNYEELEKSLRNSHDQTGETKTKNAEKASGKKAKRIVLTKSHHPSTQRHLPTGEVVQVSAYDDRRTKKTEIKNPRRPKLTLVPKKEPAKRAEAETRPRNKSATSKREQAKANYVKKELTPDETAKIPAIAEKAKTTEGEVAEYILQVQNNFLSDGSDPPWAPLELKGLPTKKHPEQAEDKSVTEKTKPLTEIVKTCWQKIPYTFNQDDSGVTMERGKEGTPKQIKYDQYVDETAHRVKDEIEGIIADAENEDKAARYIMKMADWYDEFWSMLQHEFGSFSDIFINAYAAASPQNTVPQNFKDAVDAIKVAMTGGYDELMPKWEIWEQEVEDAEEEFLQWVNAENASGRTINDIQQSEEFKTRHKALAKLREIPDKDLPRKSTGARFGFNGEAIVKVLLGISREIKNTNSRIKSPSTAPKTKTFAGNLAGYIDPATIDVWAARALQRLNNKPRIPIPAEGGVSGEFKEDMTVTGAFGFGQDVFDRVSKLMASDQALSADKKTRRKYSPKQIQAMLWFKEKQLWTKNKWTSSLGEGGDIGLEAQLVGNPDQEKASKLKSVISKKTAKTPEEEKKQAENREAAEEELMGMKQFADRFEMFISPSRPYFNVTDKTMADLQSRLLDAIKADDPGNLLLACKALSTQGVYSEPERSIDGEFVTRQTYNPIHVYDTLLEEGQEYEQDCVALCRVIRMGEKIDYTKHRPGIEINFKNPVNMHEMRDMFDALKAITGGYTVIVEPRRTPTAVAGGENDAIGVRVQYVPEYDTEKWAGKSDAEITEMIQQESLNLHKEAQAIIKNVKNISSVGQYWYETGIYYRHEYEDLLNESRRNSGAGNSDTDGRVWSGRSISDGVNAAIEFSKNPTVGISKEHLSILDEKVTKSIRQIVYVF